MKLQADWQNSDASRAVTDMLTAAGYEVYYVGGCVRNALVDMPVSDLDLSTNARPETVVELAADTGLKAIPTGIDHGTITVVSGGAPYEITTFRKDVETDGRRAVVAFSDRLEEDATRRDFTMNALYCAPDGTVIDPVGGVPDLQARHVRFINDPAARIQEDYLRILRFFRFYAWFGDPAEGLDADGLAACAEHVDGVEGLAKERIQTEIVKTLAAPDPAPAMASMSTSGVLMRILPGADTSALSLLVHLEGETGLAAHWPTRLAAINPGDVMEQLRMSKADAAMVNRVRGGALSDKTPAGMGYADGAEIATQALLLRAALTQQPVIQTDLDAARHGAAQVFPIKAADLTAFKGPALGDRLRALEKAWIVSGFALTKDQLLALP